MHRGWCIILRDMGSNIPKVSPGHLWYWLFVVMVELGSWTINHEYYYYYYYHYYYYYFTYNENNGTTWTTTLLRGLGIPHVNGLGLGVVAPPNITLVFLILIILDHGVPNYLNNGFLALVHPHYREYSLSGYWCGSLSHKFGLLHLFC